ncbi:MAG: hypothetical protein AAB433_10195 [Nitrospirota bacterium]
MKLNVHSNVLTCIFLMLIVVAGLLLISWDVEAAEFGDPKQFFKGCSVVPGVPMKSHDRISGTCLGHSFSDEGFIKTGGPYLGIPCWIGHQVPTIYFNGDPAWVVNSCNFDGRPARNIWFDLETGKLVDVKYMSAAEMESKTEQTMPTVSMEGKLVREIQNSGRYKGCTISHPVDAPLKRVITGNCAGHVFENPEIGGPNEEVNVCRLQDLGDQMFIGDCIIDGKLRRGASTITNAGSNPRVQAAAEALAKQRIEAPAKYPGLVANARARGKADPVFLGIILGEQWDWQNVNDCLDRSWSTHNSIPFCSYSDKDTEVSHAGMYWTDCVVIDKNSFDTSWIGSSSAIDYSKVQQYDGLAGLIVGMTALNMAVSDAEAEAKRESCKVYVSVLPDGTVGKVSTLTSTQSAEVEKVLSLLIKKYGNQFSTTGWRRQWALPGLTASYVERAERADGSSSMLGSLEISTAAVAREAQRSSKPAF